MSALSTAAGLIRSHFATNVEVPESLRTVDDNVPDRDIPTTGTWCRFVIAFGEDSTATVGARTFRTVGNAYAQVFVPIGVGDGAALALVDTIVDAFREQSIAGPPIVKFQVPYVSAPGAADGAFYATTVVIPFFVQETI